MAGKGSRTLISSEQKAVLVSLFEAGMSSVSNDELLQDAARRTGLEIGHIRNWIGNHKRRLKPLPSGSKPKPKHKLLYTKGKSGYNYFVGEELSTGRSNTLDEAAFKWSSLDDATKCLYRQRAAEVKAAEPTHPLSPADRHRKVKRHLKQIDIEPTVLSNKGQASQPAMINVIPSEIPDHQRSRQQASLPQSPPPGSKSIGNRTLISSEQKVVLVSLFEAGMSSVSNDELLQDAARRTGLEIGHIRNWIGNHKRTLRPFPSGSKTKPKHKLLLMKSRSGYNYFVGEELSTGRSTALKEASLKWASLDDATKCVYRQRAEAMEAAEPTHPLSPADRRRKVKRHLNQIDIEVSGLRAVGMEVVVLAFDPQNQNPIWALQTIVTNKGEGFLKATGASDDFAAYCKGVLFPSATSASFSTATASSKSERSDLSKKVTALFSQKYRDAGGEGLLPYMKAMKGYLKVNGLPDGLNLRKANRYGVEKLKKILKAADKISFEIVNQWVEENHEVGMAVPTPVNDQCVESSLPEKMRISPEPSRSGSIKQEPEDHLDTRTVSIKQEPEDHLDTNILAPQIKEEQEELLHRPEDSEVNNDDADENGETEPIASTSTDQMNTHAYIEYWVKSQLTCDDQILSSHCSDSDTEDSDEWETMEDQSADQFLSSNSSESDTKDTLKSPKAHNVEGEMLSLSNKLSQDWKSSKQTKAMVFHKRTFSVDDCGKILKRIKSYKCTICGKACRRKDYLEAHMSTHTGEKPFTCTVCGKSFTRIDNGRTHMKTHIS